MASDAPRSLDGRWYRMALSLCPPAFRREHGDEMAQDFDQARGEAAAAGHGALWMLRVLMAIDLTRTVGGQWVRTGVPVIALMSVLVSLAIAEGLAAIARRVTIPMPDGDAEVVAILFLAVISVVLIAMTITLSVWVSRSSLRGRR
jgi:hypothetical protein